MFNQMEHARVRAQHPPITPGTLKNGAALLKELAAIGNDAADVAGLVRAVSFWAEVERPVGVEVALGHCPGLLVVLKMGSTP